MRKKKVKRIESISNYKTREMLPIKRIEQIHQELYQYYLQIVSFQDKESQYQNIITKFSRTVSELEDVIEEMRKYNNNINDQLLNLNK